MTDRYRYARIFSFFLPPIMDYNEFKYKYEWKFIDYTTPKSYRCVDLVKQILQDCYALGKILAMWDAVDYLTTVPEKYPQFRYFLSNDKQLSPGDIMVADKMWLKRKDGTMTWHIAIFDSYGPITKWVPTINVLEQNGVGGTNGNAWPGNQVRIKNYPLSRFPYFLTDKELRPINE